MLFNKFLLFVFCIIVFICFFFAYISRNSKLNRDFNEPSIVFQFFYALYNSSFGQAMHTLILYVHERFKKRITHTTMAEKVDKFEKEGFSVSYVPFLEDNYAYFIIDDATGHTAVVDPADAQAISEAFEHLKNITHTKCELKLTMILTTHKHMDHSGGNLALKKMFPDVHIVAGEAEVVPGQTLFAGHKSTVYLGVTEIQILHTPCHTVGHVVYLVSGIRKNRTAAFTGDALFIGGCGRFFEGDGGMAYHSFFEVLKETLPAHTSLYCGHEYSLSNLKFGLLVEPENEAIKRKLAWVMEKRKNFMPTIPSTLADEYDYNVFLRADSPSLARRLNIPVDDAIYNGEHKGGTAAEVRARTIQVLEKLRRWKDTGKLPAN